MSLYCDYNMGASKHSVHSLMLPFHTWEMVPVNSCSTALLSSLKALAPCVAYKRPWRTFSACVLRLLFTAMPSIGPLFCVCLSARPSVVPVLWQINSAEQGLSHCFICTAGGSAPDVYLKLQCTAVIQIIMLQKAVSKMGGRDHIYCDKFYAFLRVFFVDFFVVVLGFFLC